MRNLRIPQVNTDTVLQYSSNIFKGALPSKKAASIEKASNFSRIYGEDINSNNLFGIKGANLNDYYKFLNSNYAGNINFGSLDALRQSTKDAFTNYMFDKKYSKYSNYNTIKNFEPEFKVKALEKGLDDPLEAATKTTWADYLDAIPYKLFGIRPVNAATKWLGDAKEDNSLLRFGDSILNFIPRVVHNTAEEDAWSKLETLNLKAIEDKVRPLQDLYIQEYSLAIMENPLNEQAILLMYEEVANAYAPHYQRLKGTKYLEDLSTKDKIKQLAGFQALSNINPEKAINFLDALVLNKANQNERGYKAITKALNDVTLGTVNSFLELSHAIGNEVIDAQRPFIGEDAYYKKKRAFNENNYNDWIQMIHELGDTGTVDAGLLESLFTGQKNNKDVTSSLGSSYLLNALWGVFSGLTGESSLLPDIEFIDKGTDEWGIPLNEMLRSRQTGVAINKYLTAAGEDNSLFTGRTLEEAIGMALYLVASRAASGLAMKAANSVSKLSRGTGTAYARIANLARDVNTTSALAKVGLRFANKKDALSNLFAVDVANTLIAEAYSQGVKTEVYNESMKPINEAIDNSINTWKQSEEGLKAILLEYIKRGGQFNQGVPEDADLYNSIVKEASDSLHENLLKTEYKDAEEAAYRSAVAAQLTSFYGEKARMDLFGVSRRQFMYAPSIFRNSEKIKLTDKLKLALKDPKTAREYTGLFVESVKSGSSKEGVISGLKQAGQGFIDNYLDDVTSGFAKGVGLNLFSGYIDNLYNADGTSKGIGAAENFTFGVMDFLNSGVLGGTNVAGDWLSIYDGILGAAGTFVGGNVLSKAQKIYNAARARGEFKGTPSNLRFKKVANAVLEGVSPFWETVLRTRTLAVEGKLLAEKYNKLYSDSVTTLRDFGAVLGLLEKAELDLDSVLRLKDGQHNPIIMALTLLKMLEEQMGKGSTPLSLYQKQAEDLAGLDINSEEAKSYTNSYLSVSHNSSLKTSGLSEEAQHKFVFDLLLKRAKKISDFIENLNENYDTLKYMYPNAKESAIAEVLYNRLLRSSWEERLGGLRENAIKTVSKINLLYSELTDEQRSVVETVLNKNRQEILLKVDKRTKKAPKYARSKVKVLDNEFGDALLKILAAEEVTDINELFTKDEIDTLWDAAILSDRLQLSLTYEQKALSNPIALDLYEAEVQQTWNTEILLAEASGRLANLLQQIRDSQGDPVLIKLLVSRLTPTLLEVAELYLSEEQYNFIPEELKGTEVGDSMQNASKLNVIDAIKQRKPIAEKLETITNTLNNLKNENTGLNDAQFKFIKDAASETLALTVEDLNSVEDIDKAILGIMDDPFVDDNIKDVIKRAAQGALITVLFEKAKKSQESKEEKAELKKEAESKELSKEEKAKIELAKPIETKEELKSEDLGDTINPEVLELQIEEESSKLDKKEPPYVVEETTQTPEEIEDSNNNSSITEETQQSTNNDVPLKNTLLGTHVIKYQVKPLKDKTQKKAVETLDVEETPALSWVQAVLRWFRDNNIDFLSVIDNELFYFKNAPIHFIRINHTTLFSKEFLDKHPNIGLNPNILTAVEYTDSVKKVHNKNKAEDLQDLGIIEVNGTLYLVLGLLGYDASLVAAWNQVSNFARKNTNYNEKGFALVTKDDGTPIKTTVNNIFLGRRVKSYGSNKAVNTPLHELLTNHISNPRGLTVKQLGLGYLTRSGLRVVLAPINATIVKPRDSYGEMTAGATYIFVRLNDGKYYPFMVQPARFSEINVDSSLHEKIADAVSKLLSKDYDTRYDALKTLFKYLHFSNNYNIYIGKRNQHQLTVIKDGIKFSTIDLNNPVSAEMLLTTLKDAGFRVTITPSLLTSEASLKEYSEAGVLSLDVANLLFINGSFMINGIDDLGNEVKQEPQTTNPENKHEEHSYNFYNNKLRIVKNNSKFYDPEGNEITDPDRVSDLNSISNVVGTTPYLLIKGVRYWLVNDSTVVKADAAGNYSVTHDPAEIQKTKDKKAEKEAEAKQKAAEEAAKAELERIKKELEQKEEEELGVKLDNVDEEAELGVRLTYTEDMPFEETAEINPKTGEVTLTIPKEEPILVHSFETSLGKHVEIYILPHKEDNGVKITKLGRKVDGGPIEYTSLLGVPIDSSTIDFKKSGLEDLTEEDKASIRIIEIREKDGKYVGTIKWNGYKYASVFFKSNPLASYYSSESHEAEKGSIELNKPKPLVDLGLSEKEESRDLNSRLDEDITLTIAEEEVSGTVYDIIAEHLMDEKTRNDETLADKRFNELMEEFKNSNLSLKDWLTKKINCG